MAAARPPTQQDITQANVDIARKLFFAGCALLPWVWILNLYYFRHALVDPSAPAELRLCTSMGCGVGRGRGDGGSRCGAGGSALQTLPCARAGLWRSLTGAIILTVLFVVWVIVFQTQYQNWGQTGLNLLVFQPPVWFFQ
jgi:Presenilin enhancer-2 subunit of gamma secretase